MPRRGDVLDFHYLWHREAGGGEEAGRKARPTCLLITVGANPARLYLYPITSQQPPIDRAALAIPEIERRRGGLSGPCWIVVDEFNLTTSDALYDFESLEPRGSFSSAFVRTVAEHALARIEKGSPR